MIKNITYFKRDNFLIVIYFTNVEEIQEGVKKIFNHARKVESSMVFINCFLVFLYEPQ